MKSSRTKRTLMNAATSTAAPAWRGSVKPTPWPNSQDAAVTSVASGARWVHWEAGCAKAYRVVRRAWPAQPVRPAGAAQ